MTAVGKILVFLNLVFSLAVGGFAVADYTTRTHWVDSFNKLKDQYEVVRKANETYSRELSGLTKEKADLYEKLQAQRVKWDPAAKDEAPGGRIADRALALLEEQRKQIDDLKNSNDTLRKQVATEKARVIELSSAENVYKNDNSRRQADTLVMRTTLDEQMKKNFELVKEVNQLRDETVTAQIQARTFKDRNTQLEASLREAAVQLAQLKTNLAGARPGAGAARTNPPLENVEGLVRTAKDGLVEIALGSDAGLSKNQTMEVFRLGTNPRYIGRIRILEVTASTAVGQPTGRLASPIQAGDHVASRIMGGN